MSKVRSSTEQGGDFLLFNKEKQESLLLFSDLTLGDS